MCILPSCDENSKYYLFHNVHNLLYSLKKEATQKGINPTKPLLLEGFEYEKLYVYILAYIF